MKRPSKGWVYLALILAITVFTPAAYACGKDKTCSYSHAKSHHVDLESKFFHKAHFILENHEALGLKDEEVEKIKSLKRSIKKDLVLKKAQIEVLSIDIKSGLRESAVDAQALNELYDQKYNLKKDKSKTLVAAYAELKNGLTDAQRQTMKDLWKGSKSKK